MKRNILRMTIITFLLSILLIWGSAVCAQDEELPDPGITPDSPFYFLDKLGKNFGMFFAFGPEAKARKALEYAGERLAEARVMSAKNRMREMIQAANDYNGFMARVNERAEEAVQNGVSGDISERVALAASRHLSVLDDLKHQLPETSSEAVVKARTASMNGRRNALRALARIKPERAIEINSAAIDESLNRARIKASENITAEVEQALADAETFTEIEEEITGIAQLAGKDISAIEQRLALSTSNRFEVLSEVYEKAPEQSRTAIASAMENSVRKYEDVITKLRERNASGEVTDAIGELQRTQERLRERLRALTSGEVDVSHGTVAPEQIRIQVEERAQENNQVTTSNIWPAITRPVMSASVNRTSGSDTITSQVRSSSDTP